MKILDIFLQSVEKWKKIGYNKTVCSKTKMALGEQEDIIVANRQLLKVRDKIVQKIDNSQLPPLKKRRWKKRLGLNVSDCSVIRMTQKMVAEKAAPYYDKVRRPLVKITTNIKQAEMTAMEMRAREKVYEDALHSKNYTFQDMMVIRDPYKNAPLTALILFYTKNPCKVRFTVTGDIREDNVSGVMPYTQFHRVTVLGLYPDRKNEVVLDLLDDLDNILDTQKVYIKTEPLPSDLQDVVTCRQKNGHMAYNLIFITGGVDLRTCAFDSSGVIRYYLTRNIKGYGVFRMSGGRFIFSDKEVSVPTYNSPHAIQIHEMDYMGRIHKSFYMKKGIHHNAIEMVPGGNILSCASSLDNHTEDVIVEIDRNTYEVVREFNLADVYDDYYQDMIDWTHVNAIQYDPEEKTVMVSSRNIHAITKINWETGELLWVLSDPDFWKKTKMTDKLLTPVGDIQWFYQQHAVVEVRDEIGEPLKKGQHRIMLFDNHWAKRRPAESFDNDPNSFVDIFVIDENDRTVRQEYQFPCLKSKIRSNGIYVKEKNRLFSMEGSLEPAVDGSLGMVNEFDFDTKELINQYSVETGFFSAYDFEPDYEDLAKPLPFDSNYMFGSLYEPVKLEKFDREVSEKPLKEKLIKYLVREDVLFAKAKDHSLRHIYFVGGTQVYDKDYTQTNQTNKVFTDANYSILTPLHNLKPDRYDLYVDYEGTVYKTGKWIEVGQN